MRYFWSALILLLPCALPMQAQDVSIEQRIDEIFTQWDQKDAPGASVAVVKNGAIVFEKGYGMANLEYDVPNTPSTVFHIASVSKQFTVFSVLLLQSQGKLDLDDDVRKHLPELPDFGERITLRHLATHTSGMRDQWNLLAMAGWRLDDVITKDHIMKLVERQKDLNFNPGDQFTYCNTGFTLLAEVVARVSKRTFAQFTKENIFDPLGMTNSLFYDDHELIVKNRAYSYARGPLGLKKRVLSYANVGATSLFTTVVDLAKWINNFQNPVVGDRDLFAIMDTRTVLNNGDTIGGAMGQFISEYHGYKQIQHGGADAGYRSYLGRFPDEHLSVVVLGNVSQLNAGGLAMKVADLFLEKKTEESMVTTSVGPDRTPINLDQNSLKTFTGSYWNDERKYIRKIFLNNDTLRYDRGNGYISPIIPIGPDSFQMLRVASDLIIRFTGSGRDKRMEVSVDGSEPTISHFFEPMDRTLNTLKEYQGTYYSAELATSYHFQARTGELLVKHRRLPDFTLKPAKENVFTSNRWYFPMVEFKRDENGKILGVYVSSDRVKDLWFERIGE